MAEEIGFAGLKELEATLAALPDRLGEKVLRAALRAGAQPMRKEAQALAPVLKEPHPNRKAGTVRRAISIRRSKKNKYGVFVGVRPLRGKAISSFKRASGKSGRDNPDDPYYWWFQEFGTKNHPAKPFLRPAFENKHRQALARFNQYTLQRLEKEAEKLAREKGLPKK